MIEELRIRDLGVIAEAVLELGPGFTAITGETGAGKTMVVSALGLLMGARADASAVRSGAPQARVSGIVRVGEPGRPELVELVADLGGDLEHGELVLSRTVTAEGRSRAAVGGAGAPVGSLSRLAEHLFAVHGQSEQLRLRSLSAQRDTLDRFGGPELSEALRRYRAAHRVRQELEDRATRLRETRAERTAEAQQLRLELEEIAAVDPQPGEETGLAERIEVLGNVEALRAASSAAHEALSAESDDPLSRDALGLVEAAVRELERVAAVDGRLAAVLETLRAIGYQVADAARELAAYAGDLDQEGPGELALAGERLAALTSLFRLYGPDSAAVIEYAAAGARRLAELDGDEDLVGGLEAALEAARAEEVALAAHLSALRGVAAERLSALVTEELRELALPDAAFVARLDALDALGNSGGDEVQFLLHPHPGTAPRPLAKSASGGELSRVMLALEVVLAGVDPVPTFVFDEVDAGVGGAAAIEIGRRLARLARTSQVIVVTHLAQVAAFAGNHLQVVKDSSGGFTTSSVARLTGRARLGEVARLLSGLADSSSALEHAAELLSLGSSA